MLDTTTSVTYDKAAPSRDTSPSPELRTGAGQSLWLDRGGASVRVRPVRCFPWSSPDVLISLRDEADREQHLVQRLTDLDATSRAALATALESAGFVLEVCGIESIEDDGELRVWRTQTRHGPRTFQTRLDEWPWASPDGGHLVRDLAGDLFRLPPAETLDVRSREWLWAYVG